MTEERLRIADIALDDRTPVPFSTVASTVQRQPPLRAAVTWHCRAPEPGCVTALVEAATLPGEAVRRAWARAQVLVEALRAKSARGTVEGLSGNTTCPARKASP